MKEMKYTVKAVVGTVRTMIVLGYYRAVLLRARLTIPQPHGDLE